MPKLKKTKELARGRPRRQFCLSEEAAGWLDMKAGQGYSRSALVNLLIIEAMEKENKKNAK